ncbi:hypothetical protein RIR_jg16859.t1 [Rhizophagus irregularis DAOM 181602=DAOM 197198]|nr:hypothetical protein RIR_jg16859.t1 [Rhizophagus irregularis DAOM 181602=DAOM 197198]
MDRWTNGTTHIYKVITKIYYFNRDSPDIQETKNLTNIILISSSLKAVITSKLQEVIQSYLLICVSEKKVKNAVTRKVPQRIGDYTTLTK